MQDRCSGYTTALPADQPSLVQQCIAEQKWFRQSMTRSLIYAQVSAAPYASV